MRLIFIGCVARCRTYHLYNLRNKKNTYGGVLLFVKYTCDFIKSDISLWVFFTFFKIVQRIPNCAKHLESIWKLNERVGWTEDTLDWDCCRKILQPPNVVKFMFLYNSQYLIYLNNKNHKVQINDFEFISYVFIALGGQDRCW